MTRLRVVPCSARIVPLLRSAVTSRRSCVRWPLSREPGIATAQLRTVRLSTFFVVASGAIATALATRALSVGRG